MMRKLSFSVLLLLVTYIPTAHSAEITTCIIDTSLKTNPVYYYFPITATKLRCDHIKGSTTTLTDLYKDHWRLIQLVNPILVDQKEKKAAYTPPVLYLERLAQHRTPSKKAAVKKRVTPAKPTESEPEEKGGLFNFLGGDTQSDSSEQ
jgi:hypothetical protein